MGRVVSMRIEKDINKLTSIDEEGSHISIIPAEVQGFFRKNRTRVQVILLVIFLALPWLHYKGQQLILLNISAREFNLFGILFRAHDTPLIFFLLATTALGLAFVTAVWGRIWCGWACPQTVFVDMIYRCIEQWTEGDYIKRRKLYRSPWTMEKYRKTGLKWILFFLVSSAIAHSFIAYFTGSTELLKMMQGSPEDNWTYFVLVAAFTLLLLFDFAWFREQFCVIMCPYGRIQSVLLEPSSLAVVYDEKRGEPRREGSEKKSMQGDCVACNRCVEVCPTGIDIRNGLQMECIACTACIDACDEIMEKVKKPTGLISYRTLNNSPFRIFKLKTIVYGVFILFSIGGLSYSLSTREPLNIALLRAIDSPYTLSVDENGRTIVLNHFRLHLTNQTNADSLYSIRLSEDDINLGTKLTVAQNPISLKANGSENWHLFIQAPRETMASNGQQAIKIYINNSQNQTFERELFLIGPQK